MDESAQQIEKEHKEIQKISKGGYTEIRRPDFDLTPHFLSFLTTNGFFAELSRHVHKVATRDITYAGVAFNRSEDAFVLYWNPDEFAKWTPDEVQGVLHHEFLHIVFGHLLTASGGGNVMNIAMDLAINSIIQKMKDEHSSTMKIALPGFVCNPGRRGSCDGVPYTDEDLLKWPLAKLISEMPAGKNTQQYLQTLMESGLVKNVPGELDFENCGYSFDTHESEGSANDADYIRARMKALITKAAQHADSTGNWGNMPASIKGAIQQYVRNMMNWKKVLERFVGYSVAASKRSSITRINKRYPYIHSGSITTTQARLLIGIDQSASVDNSMLSQFYTALASLTRNVEVDMLPFDCAADIADLQTWKKGSIPVMARTKHGGTNFSAITRIVNDPANKGRWDAVLILTDGEAAEPIPCNISRGWVLPKGQKMYFETKEVKIIVDTAAGLLTEF